jgi:hypothetical protein
MPNGTEPPGGRGIGTYALNQPTTGPGIRQFRYSTDLAINPHTYDSTKTVAVPHGVGSVWAEMLWEMTYALIDEHGFDANLITGNAGNNISLQLVMDGMKLQPCLPGFVDARDAILAADVANNAGANECLIWTAFAKRGLGFSATQGFSTSNADNTQAFDLPLACMIPGAPTVTGSTPSPGAVSVAFTPGAAGSSPITGYTAECVSTDGGATGTGTGAASPISVSGLTVGKSYHCRVLATNAVGDGPYSGFGATVLVPAAPVATVPGKPVITKSEAVSKKKAKISFTLASNGGSPVTSYLVSCTSKNGGKTRSATGPASPIKVKKLTPGKKYKCKVRATNAKGTGPWSKKGKKITMPSRLAAAPRQFVLRW